MAIRDGAAGGYLHRAIVRLTGSAGQWVEVTENGYFDGTRPGATMTSEEAAIVIERLRKKILKRSLVLT
ncbi:hypothetical protein KZX70_27105 [Paenibacillus silvae]|uniref:hypothetical protein n=1 Tax=Paenibacillus silvae TaxID=1325358 RepID=UPI00200695AB|nr:hypothetical protein [Paenibacillus silvae]MCK6078509.1 hypothetical protein [Paenibacillus silvae]MCK6152829.1 hypothetical protein [Paenibacillus silvae]MCK6271281.1 hypothetical protein [Paenibacillus silvae]